MSCTMFSVLQEHKNYCCFCNMCRNVTNTLQHFDTYAIRILGTEGDQNEITTGPLSEEGELVMCKME